MSQRNRALIVVAVLILIAAALGWVGLRQQRIQPSAEAPEDGFIHIYADSAFIANVAPVDFTSLPATSFQDAEEGKTQEGPWLRDLILLYVPEKALRASSTITVSGARNGNVKTHTVTWGQALEDSNWLVLDVSGSGDAIKLTSVLPDLDTRDEWVQGINRIEIVTR